MDFIKVLTKEFQCAVRVMCDVDKSSELLEKGHKLSDILPKEDLLAIFKKMKFYIYD